MQDESDEGSASSSHFVVKVIPTVSVGSPKASNSRFVGLNGASRLLSRKSALTIFGRQAKSKNPSSSVLSIQIAAFRNRNAFEITDSELKLIAAAAIIGLSKSPKNG